MGSIRTYVYLLASAISASVGYVQSAQAAPLTEPGIFVFGSGANSYKVCSTCPDEGTNAQDSSGGNGYTSATTEYNGIFSWYASGSLTGPNSLPELGVSAEVLPNQIGIGYVQATSSAQGLQTFHYSGDTTQTYEITFSVTGSLLGDAETISAGMNVYGGHYQTNSEIPGDPLGADSMQVSADPLNASPITFDESRTITFVLAPGQDFFITAYLTANAYFSDYGSLAGYADASHSMTISFTGGDTSLISVASVPIPPSAVLLASGLALGFTRKAGLRVARKPVLNNHA